MVHQHKGLLLHRGWDTLIFSYIRRLGPFFCGGGFKILNFNILGVFRKMNIFLGMKILWIFLGGHPKIGLVLRVISMYFRVFLKVNIQNRDIVLGCKKNQMLFLGAWYSWYFCGVNSRCWTQACVWRKKESTPWDLKLANLSWKNHISRITKESNNMLCFLRCKLRQASKEIKAQAYFTMVRFNLDYCSTIWSPYQRDQKHHIEMVQRRSTRFITNRCRNTCSVTDMLDYLGWKSHETRRSKLQLVVLYKIVHGLIDIPPTDYLTQIVPGPEQLTSTSISSTLHQPIVLSTASFHGQSHFGTDYQQQQLRLPSWYPSRGSCLT